MSNAATAKLSPPSIPLDPRAVNLHNWINLRAINRDHDIAHQNHQDARRLAKRSSENEQQSGSGAMPDDETFNVDSPTTTTVHNYPAPATGSGLGKALVVVLALAMGFPAGVIAWKLPEIVKALSPPPAPAITSPPPSPAPSLSAVDTQFDLYAGRPQ